MPFHRKQMVSVTKITEKSLGNGKFFVVLHFFQKTSRKFPNPYGEFREICSDFRKSPNLPPNARCRPARPAAHTPLPPPEARGTQPRCHNPSLAALTLVATPRGQLHTPRCHPVRPAAPISRCPRPHCTLFSLVNRCRHAAGLDKSPLKPLYFAGIIRNNFYSFLKLK